MDLKRLVAEMASQHGIRMDVNDPAISIVLLNLLMLERAAEEIVGGIRTSMHDFEEAVGKVQTRAGQAVAAEFNHRIASIRAELQRDIAIAGASQSERNSISRGASESSLRHAAMDGYRNRRGVGAIPDRTVDRCPIP